MVRVKGTEREEVTDLPAGWHGLITAKTYLEVNPTARVAILDKYSTIGGVWAQQRLYPGLKTNNMLGTYEYSDAPMTGENAFGIKPGEHIPGTVVHEYLKCFAEKFDIFKLCRFGETVVVAEKLADAAGWVLTVDKSAQDTAAATTYKLSTRKMVVATGLTSQPFLPALPGQEAFDAPIVHCGNLLDWSEELFASATNVVVFGGTKSAWDAAYMFAIRGIHVDWVIRESGHGPAWMAPPYVTPLKKWLEKLTTTRLLTWMSPCVWGGADGFAGPRWFLHNTAVGRGITKAFWAVLTKDLVTLNAYDKHPETAKLKPWIDAFWTATGLSILNYPTNFFDLVKEGKISVHISEITQLTAKSISIQDSASDTATVLHADALICSTGWKFQPALKFVSASGAPLDAQLGLPHYSPEPDTEDPTAAAADAEILARFPMLQARPKMNPKLTPLRKPSDPEGTINRGFSLYRFMVPPALIRDRTVAFNGMLQSVTTPIVAQAQALWLTAYLDGKLATGAAAAAAAAGDGGEKTLEDAVVRETALYSRFGRWRYPGGYGERFPDFIFDAIPYIDLLLTDLGLSGRRKGGFVSECFAPYGPEDYRGLVAEWQRSRAPAPPPPAS